MLTLFENATIYAPEKMGEQDVLFDGESITQIGGMDKKALLQSGLEIETHDLKGQLLIPGIIDPHAHLLGGSGEHGGFSSQTPEITLTELTLAGTTVVVGTLGADTTMKTMPGLLAKAKGLQEEGLSAYIWTGGYTVPPSAIMGDVTKDIMFIEEVIGTGEVAIADDRSNEPEVEELAKLISRTHVAGMLSQKAGRTHFHVGGGKRKMKCLFDVLDLGYEIKAEFMYPTHVNRSRELIQNAVKLTKLGSFVDMDTVEEDLDKWLPMYLEEGGPLKQLTLSSDAALTSPGNLFKEVRKCVQKKLISLEEILPCITTNTSKALKLGTFGRIAKGCKANFVSVDAKTLDIIHVVSRGEFKVRDGKAVKREKFLEDSNRRVDLTGEKVDKPGGDR